VVGARRLTRHRFRKTNHRNSGRRSCPSCATFGSPNSKWPGWWAITSCFAPSAAHSRASMAMLCSGVSPSCSPRAGFRATAPQDRVAAWKDLAVAVLIQRLTQGRGEPEGPAFVHRLRLREEEPIHRPALRRPNGKGAKEDATGAGRCQSGTTPAGRDPTGFHSMTKKAADLLVGFGVRQGIRTRDCPSSRSHGRPSLRGHVGMMPGTGNNIKEAGLLSIKSPVA